MNSALLYEVNKIRSIRLIGAPSILILDYEALIDAEGKIPDSLIEKVKALYGDIIKKLIIISESKHKEEIKSSFREIPSIQIVDEFPEDIFTEKAIAIIAKHYKFPKESTVFYVGNSKKVVNDFVVSRYKFSEGTEQILGYLNMTIIQERAGVAFREAENKVIPETAEFDKESIFEGIARRVSFPNSIDELVQHYSNTKIKLDEDYGDYIQFAFPVLEACAELTGAITASPVPPSENFPNYRFFWQRDAGQVIVALANLAKNTYDELLQHQASMIINNYVNFVTEFSTNENLGISRYSIEGTPIDKYGNPQLDGPCHTVLAILSALGESEDSLNLIKPFLNYLSKTDEYTYDCWELFTGKVFNVLNLKRRVFRKAALLSKSFGEEKLSKKYFDLSENLRKEIENFYSKEKGHILSLKESLNPQIISDCLLDINIIGSIIDGYDEADLRDNFFNVDDERVLKTVRKIEEEFIEKWPVNIAWRKAGNYGMGIGRFPFDMNDGYRSTGGKPWTFATLWYSQYYYRLIQRYEFLKKEYDRELLLNKAEGALRFVLTHLAPDELTEQIDGFTGKKRGAKKLAWAHAQLINTLLIRNEVIGAKY